MYFEPTIELSNKIQLLLHYGAVASFPSWPVVQHILLPQPTAPSPFAQQTDTALYI